MIVSGVKLVRTTSPDGQTVWRQHYNERGDMFPPDRTAYLDSVYEKQKNEM